MIKWTLFFILFTALVYPQHRKTIDSINSVSYEEKISRTNELVGVYLENVSHAKKIGYKMGEAESYSNLALIYYYQGKYNLNVDYALKAIQLYEQLGANNKLATELGGLGYGMKRRNMQKALYYMRKGKSLTENLQDSSAMLSIYNNYGVLMEMQNKLDSALHFYKKGLVVKQHLKDSLGLPYSLNNIAGIYVMQKRFSAAEELYEKAFQIRVKRNDQIGIAENLTYFGDLYFAQKDYRKALTFYQRSVDQASKFGYIYLMQSNYKSISDCYGFLGQDKQALLNYKLHTRFKDSLLNKETNAKIAELDVRYEASEKEKQLAQQRNLLQRKETESRYKNNVLAVLSLLSVFIALTGYLIYRQQRLKNMQMAQEHELKTAISHVETQNKLQEQRLGISRDLHDNIGSQLTFIISSVDNIKYAFDLKNKVLDQKLQSISNFTKDTILELRDTIWAMNNSEITFEDLLSRVANFIDKARDATNEITYTFDVDEKLQSVKLSSVVGMNIYRTIQEAIHNAIKYSDASSIRVTMVGEENRISITVADDGKGFDANGQPGGNGLRNMEKRISEIGGEYHLESIPEIGTVVKILFEYPKVQIE